MSITHLPIETRFSVRCCRCGTLFTAHNDASDPTFGRSRFTEMRLEEGWAGVGMADELAMCPSCSKVVHDGT